VRTLLDQRLRFAERAIVNGHRVARPDQVRRHAGSHVPKPDESDFHDLTSSL